MTFEEWFDTLEAGIEFFDDFRDNDPGVAVPSGWTLVDGQTPTIIEDSRAFGRRALQLSNLVTAPTGLVFDAPGTPDHFEIIMRLKTTAEMTLQEQAFLPETPNSAPSHPRPTPPLFGGPGGRLQLDGPTDLIGVGARGTARSADCFCSIFCGFGPSHGAFRPATGTVRSQNLHFIARNTLPGPGSFAQAADVVVPQIRSGSPSFAPGFTPPNPAFPPGGPQCPTAQFGNPPGTVVSYTFMRIRVGDMVGGSFVRGRFRAKWWPGLAIDEPGAWPFIGTLVGSHLPPIGGGVGILHTTQGDAEFRIGSTVIDYILVSIDPVDFPLDGRAPPEEIGVICPLPNTVLGEPYLATLDPDGLFQNEE